MSQFEKKYPDTFRLYPRPSYLLLYKEPHASFNRFRNLSNNKKTPSNSLSKNSAMKMRRAISWLVASAEIKEVFEKREKKKVKWRINFITLTLPTQNNLDDRVVKRILNEFIKWARYNHGLKSYVWKAEIQKRGELHIHLMSDCYIHHTNVRFAWNRLLKNYGLLNGHSNPNSTDVHAIMEDKVRDTLAYCVDYMQKKGKDEEGEIIREIKGRLWGCSKELSNAGKGHIKLDEDEAENLHNAFKAADWRIKQVENTSTFMYMVGGKGNLYNYIQKDDPIHSLYKNELTLIKSNQKQLELFERQSLAALAP